MSDTENTENAENAEQGPLTERERVYIQGAFPKEVDGRLTFDTEGAAGQMYPMTTALLNLWAVDKRHPGTADLEQFVTLWRSCFDGDDEHHQLSEDNIEWDCEPVITYLERWDGVAQEMTVGPWVIQGNPDDEIG